LDQISLILSHIVSFKQCLESTCELKMKNYKQETLWCRSGPWRQIPPKVSTASRRHKVRKVTLVRQFQVC